MIQKAFELRREQTPTEARLWTVLRAHKVNGISFRRQHAIGNTIVDFCSVKHKLVIELDGSQHLDHRECDQERTKYLVDKGYKVIRFWNSRVERDMEGVVAEILNAIAKR